MHDLSESIRVLLAVAPGDHPAALTRVLVCGLVLDVCAEIAVDQAPPEVIVVGAAGWRGTLARLRASYPFATRVVLADDDGPDLKATLLDGAHDVLAPEEPARAIARSLRLGAYRAQMEQRFAEIRRRYRAAVHSAGAGTMRWDLTDHSMTFDPGWKAMLGYADDEHGDDTTAWFSRVHPADQTALRQRLRGVLDGAGPVAELDYRLQHRDGSWLWAGLRLELTKVASDHFVLVGSQEDITVEKVSAQRVAWADRHDSLTGLLGRAAFVDAVEARLGECGTCEDVLGVCDIDGLKAINGAHGRDAGDEVLLWLAGLLEDRLGDTALTARLTGDKFAFLLPNMAVQDARSVAVGLREELRAEIFLAGDGTEFSVSACLIVAARPVGAEHAQAWLGAVDRGLTDATLRGDAITVLQRDVVDPAFGLGVAKPGEPHFS